MRIIKIRRRDRMAAEYPIARVLSHPAVPQHHWGKLVRTHMTQAPSAATGGIGQYSIQFETGEQVNSVSGNLLNFNGSSGRASSGQASMIPTSGIARIRQNHRIPQPFWGKLIQFRMIQPPNAPGRNGIPLYEGNAETGHKIPTISGDLLNFNVSSGQASAQASVQASAQAAPKQSRGTARQIRPEEIAERSQPGLRKGKAVQLVPKWYPKGYLANLASKHGYHPDPSQEFARGAIGRVRQMKIKEVPGAIAVDIPGITTFVLAHPRELVEVENDRAFPTNSLKFRVGDIVRVIENTYDIRSLEPGTIVHVKEVRENGDLIVVEELWHSGAIIHQSGVEFVSDDRNQGGRRKTNRKKKNKNKSRRTHSY
jgi:hypothetical protein